MTDIFDRLGLAWVGSHEMDGDPYSFYELGVWKNDDGYFLGTDAGCSCPMPFENYGSLEDFTGPLTAEQAREEARSIFEDSYVKYDPEGFEELIEQIF